MKRKVTQVYSSSPGKWWRWVHFVCFLVVLLMSVGPGFAKGSADVRVPPSAFFVANEAQWEEPFLFKMESGNTTYFVTEAGLTIDIRQYDRPAQTSRMDELDPFDRHHEPEPVSVRGHVLKMNFVGAQTNPQIIGQEKLASYSNYFIGRDSCNWRSRVKHYQRVVMEEVWSGIDVEFRAQPDGVETLYHVKPGADPSQIVIEYEGLDAPLHTDSQGNLILATSIGNLTEKAPWAYQIVGNRQQEVAIQFQVIGDNRCILNPESFDRGKELVIDPLIYGSYFGGTYTDNVYDMTRDAEGHFIMCGSTQSTDFPTTPGAYQESFEPDQEYSGGYVSKFSIGADSLIFSTYLASEMNYSTLYDCAVESIGSIFAVGSTYADDWPLTGNALQSIFGGRTDGIFVRINSSGDSLLYSTYFGGEFSDFLLGVAIDNQGLVYISGEMSSLPNYLITPDALFPQQLEVGYDGFLAVFNTSTSDLVYSSYLPGNDQTVLFYTTLESPGRVWLNGFTYSDDLPITASAYQPTNHSAHIRPEAYLIRWNIVSNEIEYATYLGGDGVDNSAQLNIVDSTKILVCGYTSSPDFPWTSGAFDTTVHEESTNGFVCIIDLDSGLVASSLLSGTGDGWDICVQSHMDSTGVTLGGETRTTDFPWTPGAIDSVVSPGGDMFVCQLSLDLRTMLYGTFLGGSGGDNFRDFLKRDASDTIWVFGETGSTDFPTTPNAYRPTGGGVENLEVVIAAITLPALPVDNPNEPVYLPDEITLSTYPNPFNNLTQIAFTLPHGGLTSYALYNVLGRLVDYKSLGYLSAGIHNNHLDLHDLPSGIYTIRLKSRHSTANNRLVLVK